MLTFEYGRYMKATIGLFVNDQTACFGRMCPPITDEILGIMDCEGPPRKCRSVTMKAMHRKIETAHRVSKKYYSNSALPLFIRGEIQGKGDVASAWANPNVNSWLVLVGAKMTKETFVFVN